MSAFLIVLICAGIAWAFHYYYQAAKNETYIEDEFVKSSVSELKVNIPGIEIEKPASADLKAPQESIDSLYAKTNEMWVCRHCETLNDEATHYCLACGCKNK